MQRIAALHRLYSCATRCGATAVAPIASRNLASGLHTKGVTGRSWCLGRHARDESVCLGSQEHTCQQGADAAEADSRAVSSGGVNCKLEGSSGSCHRPQVILTVDGCVLGSSQLSGIYSEHNVKDSTSYIQGWAWCPMGAASGTRTEIHGQHVLLFLLVTINNWKKGE